MSLIDIKTKMQKNFLGRTVIKIYHYCYAVPMSKIFIMKYKLKSNRKIFRDLAAIQFFSDSETFKKIKEDKMSLCRFGDGEMTWICGDSKGYFGQKNSKELSERLIEVLSSTDKNVLIGIPKFFDDMKEYSDRRKNARNVHLSKYADKWYELCCKKENKYADALITRVFLGRDTDYEQMFAEWKQIWDNRTVVVIEGEQTYFGVGNDLLSNAKKVSRIICPAENAFASYNIILETALKCDKNSLILTALGPTATILSYDLAVQGYQAIDIGHLDIEYEWYLMNDGSGQKKNVRGKYVNEAGGAPQDVLSDELLKIHDEQIVFRCV